MVKSRLFIKIFSTIIVAVMLFSFGVYVMSVPLIEEKAYEIELNASRTILDNVFEMASKIDGNLEEQRRVTLEAHKRQLQNIGALGAAYLEFVFARADRGEISPEEARLQAFEGLRAFKYGSDGYIWVTDYQLQLLSHPDPGQQGRSAADLRGIPAEEVLPVITRIAREQGQGFHTYLWPRLGGTEVAPKMSYFIDLPKRGLVVGTGVYLDDVDREVARRKGEAVAELRQALRNIRLARTGYVYIFDAANQMLIHPNPNIEGADFGTRIDPATGRSISEELKEAADGDQPLHYLWDKPSDPDNYAYEKISWVRHFRGFDWYIASSVYVEELRRSSAVLADRIMLVALALMAVASAFGYVAARRLVSPLNRLAETAAQVRAGDLEAASGVVRDDEIGVLASAFDDMVRQLRDNFATLDSRVRERTTALQEVNLRLRDAIASQREAQEALGEIEARQRLILDAIPASIAYLDRDERIRFANRRWAALVGRDKTTVIGQPLRAVISPRAYAHLAPYVEQTRRGLQASFEYAFTGPGGRRVVTKNTLIPQIAAGESVGLFVLTLDITDEKETERHLMEAQRLKAVGQLSGGLAHDFNNLLSIILGNLAAARERYADVEGLEGYLEPAQRASRRGADITSRLLAFSRQQPLKPAAVDACALIRESAVLLRRSLPSTIELVVDGEECWTLADPGQLENALVNLALNARDAMPDGGRLCLVARRRSVADSTTVFDEPVPAGDYVELRVQDDGVGFAPHALASAFEPFFTTKELGSGLGLSMVYGFVKQSRGFIHLDSACGGGTAVTILLPWTSQRAAPPEPPPPPAPPDERWTGQLAMIAEDNEDVRQVLRQQLIDLGFSVVEAESGDEAADLLNEIEGIQLVVSDIVMPGLSGIELARLIRRSWPGIEVMLISGFSVETNEDLADIVVLRKPWDKQDMIDAIRRLVERTPA